MKLYVYRNKGKVAYCQLLQTRFGDYEIAYMRVDPEFRGKGLATQLLIRAKRIAENQGVDLVAFLDPDGTGLTEQEEREWLKRHGFKRGKYDLTNDRPRTFGQYLRMRPDNRSVMIYETTSS